MISKIHKIQVIKYQDEHGNVYDTIEEGIKASALDKFKHWYFNELAANGRTLYAGCEAPPCDPLFTWLWEHRVFISDLLASACYEEECAEKNTRIYPK